MKKTYGIALSGGAVRGAAHIGVLKALEEYGIFPSVISGSSAGSIIGCFYAAGYSPDEMEKIILKTNILSYIKPAMDLTALFSLENLEKLLQQYIGVNDISQLNKKLYICATNLNLGTPEYFAKGNPYKIISASSALPFIFKPVKIGGYVYVDGGIMDNLPVEPLLKKVDFIIGSEVNPLGAEKNFNNPVNILLRSFFLAVRANVEARKKYCNLFLQPPELRQIGLFSTWKIKDAIEIGYRYTKAVLKEYFKQE